MRDVTKGPGDLWHPGDEDMDAYEAWLEELDRDPERKLEFMESWMHSKQTVGGRVVHMYGDGYASVFHSYEDSWLDWMAEQFQALKFRGEL